MNLTNTKTAVVRPTKIIIKDAYISLSIDLFCLNQHANDEIMNKNKQYNNERTKKNIFLQHASTYLYFIKYVFSCSYSSFSKKKSDYITHCTFLN